MLSTAWARVPRDVRFCTTSFLVWRLLVCAVSVFGWYAPEDVPEPATHWIAEPAAHWWDAAFTGLERHDALWYLQISKDGYAPGDPSSAFFPLYPLLIRLVSGALGGHPLLAAYVISNAALLVSLVLLHRLTAAVAGQQIASASVLLLLANPLAFFFGAPYTESLFLMLSLLCMNALRQDRWAQAALTAALSSATRSTGLALGVAMAVRALEECSWVPRSRASWKRLAYTLPLSACAALGTVAYLAYWEHLSTWREPFDVQKPAFQRQATWPWVALSQGVRVMLRTLRYPGWLIENLEAGLALVFIALAVVALRRFPPTYGGLVVASVVMPLCLARPFSPLTSAPRYYMVAFPLTWALAGICRRHGALNPVLLVFGALQVLHLMLTVIWHYVL
jgi:hypothetical protein